MNRKSLPWSRLVFYSLGGFMLLLAAIYFYLAYAPTGYARFKGEKTQALRRLNEALHTPVAPPPVASSPRAGAASAAPVPVEGSNRVASPALAASWRMDPSTEQDPWGVIQARAKERFGKDAIWDFDLCRQAITCIDPNAPSGSAFDSGGDTRFVWVAPDDPRAGDGWHVAGPKFSDPLREFNLAAPRVHEALRSEVAARIPGHLWEVQSGPSLDLAEHAPLDPAWRWQFHRLLDDMDALLAEEHSAEWASRLLQNPATVSGLAVFRALARGENDKAAFLLERLANAVRLDSLIRPTWERDPSIYSAFSFWRFSLGGMFLALPNFADFPVAALDRTQTTLDSARVSRDWTDNLRIVLALDAAERFRDIGTTYGPSKQNRWTDLYILEWRPADTLSQLLRPVYSRRAENLAAALAHGDVDEILNADAGLAELDRLSAYNLRNAFYTHGLGHDWARDLDSLRRARATDPVAYRAMRRIAEREIRGEPNNDFLDDARLVLAAVRFRIKQGRYPKTIRELVDGGYLVDTGFLRTSFVETGPNGKETVQRNLWTILYLDEFSYSLFPDDAPWSDAEWAKAYRSAFWAYRNKRHRHPSSMADLAPFFPKGAAVPAAAERTARGEPIPVFCRFRIDLDNRAAAEQILGRAMKDKGLELSDKDREDLKRLEKSSPRQISVRLVWPPVLPFPNELIELLRERPGERSTPRTDAD